MELKASYFHPHWRMVLQGSGLHTMADWLALDKQRVDEPNQRGDGLSEVFRATIPGLSGEPVDVYIKHQRNYVRRTLRHPLAGEPTLYQEYKALMLCWQAGVPVAEPLFFAGGPKSDNQEAMLVSLNLAGFDSLDQLNLAGFSEARRGVLIRDVARIVRLLHKQGLVHQNLYPKHVFVCWREELAHFDVRFIDMERCRPHHQRLKPRLRDLDTLARRASGFTARDRLRFLREYLDTPLATGEGRWWLARLGDNLKSG